MRQHNRQYGETGRSFIVKMHFGALYVRACGHLPGTQSNLIVSKYLNLSIHADFKSLKKRKKVNSSLVQSCSSTTVRLKPEKFEHGFFCAHTVCRLPTGGIKDTHMEILKHTTIRETQRVIHSAFINRTKVWNSLQVFNWERQAAIWRHDSRRENIWCSCYCHSTRNKGELFSMTQILRKCNTTEKLT